MPPHGGHHHHGHGGGGRIPPFYGGGWYPGYDSGVQLFTVDNDSPCPSTQQPVVGADGLVYTNACKARMAGTRAVKSAMSGFSMTIDDKDMTTPPPCFWVGIAVGAVGVTILRAMLR